MPYSQILGLFCGTEKANLDQCSNGDYPQTRIIKVSEVEFPKNEFCDNTSAMDQGCEATDQHRQDTIAFVKKYCNERTECHLHLDPTKYAGLHLPCAGRNVKIRINIIYSCRKYAFNFLMSALAQRLIPLLVYECQIFFPEIFMNFKLADAGKYDST